MTFVQLLNWDGTCLVVPVEEFVSETFSNWVLKDPAMLRVLKLKLNPRADVEALRQAFNDVLSDVAATDLGENLGDLDEASVNVADQNIFGIEVWFSVTARLAPRLRRRGPALRAGSSSTATGCRAG